MSVPVGITALAGLAAVPPLSYLVEALRSAPVTPEELSWAPGVPVQWIEVDGMRIRYVATGSGVPIVLLHTLRTQLDMFQRVVPDLAKRFRVYALDYPGHGYSDIPKREYSPELFVTAVSGFLEALGIDEAVVVGESIGGTIGLLLAARHNKRVRAVVAVNPYDYDRGRGLRRSSLLANVLFGVSEVPILGGTVMRLRNRLLVRRILRGGVARKSSMPRSLAREMTRVGDRKGHYVALMSLVRHWPEWEEARREYGNVQCPVFLLYGKEDWSNEPEREANRRDIPGVRMRVTPHAGHFFALDDPDELIRSIYEFNDELREPSQGGETDGSR
jgi:pimeloyl-ACP methyl ester carboxylesterase